jgi:hypothetical protein
MADPGNVTVAAGLVRHLRNAVTRELSTALEILAIQLDTTLDPATYNDALARFHDAQALFDAIGMTEEPQPADLLLDLDRWPRLLLKLLEREHDAELQRLQDATTEGFAPPIRDLPALRSLTTDLREQLGAAPEDVALARGVRAVREARESPTDAA